MKYTLSDAKQVIRNKLCRLYNQEDEKEDENANNEPQKENQKDEDKLIPKSGDRPFAYIAAKSATNGSGFYFRQEEGDNHIRVQLRADKDLINRIHQCLSKELKKQITKHHKKEKIGRRKEQEAHFLELKLEPDWREKYRTSKGERWRYTRHTEDSDAFDAFVNASLQAIKPLITCYKQYIRRINRWPKVVPGSGTDGHS